MPYIDARITKKLTDDEKAGLVAELGRALALIGKPESYLMTEISDGRELYFAGKKLENGAYVAVDVCADRNPAGSPDFTAEVCKILGRLGVPADCIYVEYRHTPDWGWNNTNF